MATLVDKRFCLAMIVHFAIVAGYIAMALLRRLGWEEFVREFSR